MNYIGPEEVAQLLSMKECIEEMRKLFLLNSDVGIVNPLRSKMKVNSSGILGMMPASIDLYKIFGLKIITVYPDNYKKGLSSHQGIFHLFSAENGQLLTTLDADKLTAIRTAAVSALATYLMAIDNAETLCLMGSGTQALMHLESISLVRPVRRVKVWSNSPESDKQFLEKVQDKYNIGFEVCSTAKDAVSGSDIICTLTSASEPILKSCWLEKHAHINAVGACTPDVRELDSDTVTKSEFIVDSYDSALNESGDLLLACLNKETARKQIKGSLEELLKKKIRVDKSRISVFESLGLAIEDLASAYYCYYKQKNLTT